MTDAAPRLHPLLLAAVVVLDDDDQSLAELNRRVGALARKHALVKPSYAQVRRVALAERVRAMERRRQRRERLERIVDTASAGYATAWSALPELVELIDRPR